jgi:SAM-dependent methyltransferase
MICPSCSGTNVDTIGTLIKSPGLFDLRDPGRLYHCQTCNLYFRRPYLSSHELVEAYGNIVETNWDYNDRRNDFRLAFEAALKIKQSGNVLDIGCYRGDFLQLFPDRFLKYGIEPSQAAARSAQSAGVRIIGNTVEHFENEDRLFDIITIIDVLEHLPSPFTSLSKLSTFLNRDGIIILSTGNTDALPWRLMRLDYWYYFSEHVSFFNPRWFKWAVQKLQLRLLSIKKFSHVRGSVFERWRQFLQCLTFIAVKKFDSYPRIKRMSTSIYPFSKAIDWERAPATRLWKDHQLVILQRK